MILTIYIQNSFAFDNMALGSLLQTFIKSQYVKSMCRSVSGGKVPELVWRKMCRSMSGGKCAGACQAENVPEHVGQKMC